MEFASLVLMAEGVTRVTTRDQTCSDPIMGLPVTTTANEIVD